MKKLLGMDPTVQMVVEKAAEIFNKYFGGELDEQNRLSDLIHDVFARTHYDPLVFLRVFQWEIFIPVGVKISQAEFTVINQELDPRGCFGRIVMAAMMLDTFFPECRYYLAEVVEDDLAKRMQEKLSVEENPRVRSEMIAELLTYEEPHMVLVINDQQFDPLVRYIPDINHPKILVHKTEPWKMITAGYLASQALAENDLVVRHVLLQEAKRFCYTNQIKQLEVGCKIGLNTATRSDIESLLAEIPNARNMYMMREFLDDQRIFDHYPEDVVEALDLEFEDLVLTGGV